MTAHSPGPTAAQPATGQDIALLGLVAVLALATAVRIYRLDEPSLAVDELQQVMACSPPDWAGTVREAMARLVHQPIGYSLALCSLLAWFPPADFLVRVPAVIIGVAVVFLVYRLGSRFFSSLAGLLAAAWVGTTYAMVQASREVDPAIFLACLLLAHFECFCSIVFRSSGSLPAPFELDIGRGPTRLQLRWQPAVPVDPLVLLGFWGTGMLALLTGYSAWVVLLLMATGFCLVRHRLTGDWHLRAVVSLYTPLALVALLWASQVYPTYGPWILSGEFFSPPPVGQFLANVHTLFAFDTAVYHTLLGLLLLALASLLLDRLRQPQRRDVCFASTCLLLGSVSLLLAWLHGRSLIQSHLFESALFILVIAGTVARGLDRVLARWPRWRWTVAFYAMVALMVFQLGLNQQQALYSASRAADFRQAVAIVQADSSFMQGARVVFASHDLFAHYLAAAGLDNQRVQWLDERQPLPIARVQQAVDAQDFYFLEYRPPGQVVQDQPFAEALARHFTPRCTRQIGALRVSKYSREPAAVPPQPVPACRMPGYS